MAEEAPFTRWVRIEGRLDSVEARLRSLEITSAERMTYIHELTDLLKEFAELKSDLRKLERHYLEEAATREAAQVARLERRDQDRKVSHRWQIGATLTAIGLIIAAAAILVQILQSAPTP